ncbi:MAG: hypothetical protein WC238_04415 [Parcubacteria group bacterium]|jgi:hypothetical protein
MKTKKNYLIAIFGLVFLTMPFFGANALLFTPKLCGSSADCPKTVDGRSVSCRNYYDPYTNNSDLKRCLPPEVGQGGSCNDDLYGGYLCKSPLVCFFDEGKSEASKCLPKRKAGESCNIAESQQCEGEMSCEHKICEKGVGQGEKCNEYGSPRVYCNKGLMCDNSGDQTCVTIAEFGIRHPSSTNSTPPSNNASGSETSNSPFDYQPLENIPGFESEMSGDFYVYISLVYKFGIWAVGIAALLMISIGGYMYVTSAGNNSSMEKAKGVITDAVVGLILALTSYLLLYIINPDLVKITPLPQIAPSGPTTGSGVSAPRGTPGGSAGNCQPATAGPCSIASIQQMSSCFGNNVTKASAICLKESGNSETVPSGVDKCQPGGESVSYGLFQINLTAQRINGLDCPSSCGPMYTSKNHNCSITNKSLFDQCVSAAKSAKFNIEKACALSSGGSNWGQWGANTNQRDGCHF